MKIVILGLSITSSWGNGHATTYRSLVRALTRRGHDALFLERDMPWYGRNRDFPEPYGCTRLYTSLGDLERRFRAQIGEADLVIVGSYVPEGVAVGQWVLETARGVAAFYDIDTPVTLAKLERGDTEYLSPELIPRFDLYLSFTAGPILDRLEQEYGAPMARPLFCSVDPDLYYPTCRPLRWDLGYLGTYSDDRQPALERLLLEAARLYRNGSFVVAGPLYPGHIQWPPNVERFDHLPPRRHREFYNSQRCTLNVTRAEMKRAGYSPSVRLFEAAACATPIISDYWPGLENIFEIGREILVSRSAGETLRFLREMPGHELARMGERARERVLAGHTAAHRARELELYVSQAASKEAVQPENPLGASPPSRERGQAS